jgi:hypothetical protein
MPANVIIEHAFVSPDWTSHSIPIAQAWRQSCKSTADKVMSRAPFLFMHPVMSSGYSKTAVVKYCLEEACTDDQVGIVVYRHCNRKHQTVLFREAPPLILSLKVPRYSPMEIATCARKMSGAIALYKRWPAKYDITAWDIKDALRRQLVITAATQIKLVQDPGETVLRGNTKVWKAQRIDNQQTSIRSFVRR